MIDGVSNLGQGRVSEPQDLSIVPDAVKHSARAGGGERRYRLANVMRLLGKLPFELKILPLPASAQLRQCSRQLCVQGYTPAPLEADCQDIFDTARTLIATLGQPVFEPLVRQTEGDEGGDEVFFCRSSNYDATGQYTEEGMVVLKGSKARKEQTPSMAKYKSNSRRDVLIAEGAMVLEGGFYVFQRDVLFKSPSGASDAISGASTNGWTLWKTKAGKTLDELKRI